MYDFIEEAFNNVDRRTLSSNTLSTNNTADTINKTSTSQDKKSESESHDKIMEESNLVKKKILIEKRKSMYIELKGILDDFSTNFGKPFNPDIISQEGMKGEGGIEDKIENGKESFEIKESKESFENGTQAEFMTNNTIYQSENNSYPNSIVNYQ